MTPVELSRFDELASRYLDDALSDGESAELATLLAEPLCAARFLELTRLNSTLIGLLAAPVPDAAMVELVQTDIEQSAGHAPAASAAPRLGSPVLSALAWAAVVLVLCGLAAAFFMHRTRFDDAPAVALVQGQLRVLGPAGEQALTPGQSWRPNETILTIGPHSAATVTFIDGSQLVFGGDTVAANESDNARRRVVLERGSVQATLNGQTTGHPFVFASAEAETVVLRAKFRIAVGDHDTRLEVSEGEALFRRLRDGAEITVKADHYAVASPDVPFIATPFHPEPHPVP